MSLAALKLPFYPAHPSNYSPGRVKPIRVFTVHHIAGTPSTLRYLWANPGRNASSTLGAFEGYSEQYVALSNTPWTNGNFSSNSEAITCEVYGDWRAGRVYHKSLAQLKRLMRAARQEFPHLVLNFHQDVSSKYTECPAELRSHAQRVWNEITAEFNAPAPKPQPAPSRITYKPIAKKTVQLKWAANLWNFNFVRWPDAKPVEAYPKGHQVDVVAIATNSLGGQYYMTAYSYDEGRIRATAGFNTKDVADYIPPKPAPKPEPKPAPPAPRGTIYTRYKQPVRVETLNDKTKLWDFSGKTWGDIAAKPVDEFAKGHLIDVVGDAEHPLGGVYLMTGYSFGDGDPKAPDFAPHKTWGVNAVDARELEVLPEPEPIPSTEPAPEPPQQPEPPADDDPASSAGPGDLSKPLDGEDARTWLTRLWQAVLQYLSKFKFRS